MIECNIRIHFDGGCFTNPGPAAGAAVLYFPDHSIITVSQFLPQGTNNEAEYIGLIVGMQKAIDLSIQNVEIFGDSELIIKQVRGEYRCKKGHLIPLRDRAVQLSKKFQTFSLKWIPRARNSDADAVATEALNNALGLKPMEPEIANYSAPQPPDSLKEMVQDLNRKGAGAGFDRFLRLKVPDGQDDFSRQSYNKLVPLVPREVLAGISGALAADKQIVARALRWYLRGLVPGVAVRKVQIDAEVAANLEKSRR